MSFDFDPDVLVDYFVAHAREAAYFVGSDAPLSVDMSKREIYRLIDAENITGVEVVNDGTAIHLLGEFEYLEIVDRIPATRWDPPEVCRKDRLGLFTLIFDLTDPFADVPFEVEW